MTVDIAVTGATGRMGREVLAAAARRDDVDVAFAVNRAADGGEVAGVEVHPTTEYGALLADRGADALVDFTGPASSQNYVAVAAEAGVAAVVGTTGFDEGGEAVLRETSQHVPVLKAANFARGVQALQNAVERAVGDLPGYDIEVTETHHNAKRDAPSGTANALLDRIDDARGDSERVHGREGDQPREDGEIGVHARRAGNVTGEHEVLVAGNHEEVRLTHRAESRGVFAEGALDAAVWLTDREPGWYDFADVVGDSA